MFDINQAGPSTSYIGACDDQHIEPCTSYFKSDKSVQVNIKPKYWSKGINVNIPTEKKNVALLPYFFYH